MRTLRAGHHYLLDNLKSGGSTEFHFYQDEDIHGKGVAGPSCQEVIRMLIARVRHLDIEKPWWGNRLIIRALRTALVLFEARALEMKVLKGHPVEDLPVGKDGHIC